MEQRDIPEPTRDQLRSDRELPSRATSKTDTAEPMRPKDLNEKVEPRQAWSTTDKENRELRRVEPDGN